MRALIRGLGALPLAAALMLTATPQAEAVSRPDPWITTKVKMALLTTEEVEGLAVNVDTVDGRVTLHGTVATAEAKSRAQQAAEGIEGVRAVRNLLQVEGKEDAASRSGVPDEELRAEVESALADAPGLAESDVEVRSVNEGVVLLGGEAGTLSAHRQALETATQVEGVRQVSSEIQSPDELGDAEIWSRGSSPEEGRTTSRAARDLWITTKTKVALLTSEGATGLGTNVDTRNGVVTLFGTAASEEAKQASAERARRIEGVERVENELQVVPEAEQEKVAESDERVREAIDRRLDERADLEGASIDVAVADGVARLSGVVEGHGDHLTVLTVARETQGVRSLVDDLRIEPPAVSAEPPSRSSDDPSQSRADDLR